MTLLLVLQAFGFIIGSVFTFQLSRHTHRN